MLQPLDVADLPAAAKLLAGEGWNFTTRELGRLLATGPGLSVAAWEGAELRGLLTVTRHGDLAWVGNVVTHPQHRGKGLGEAMVRDALARCAAAGVTTVKLCAVAKAETLYRRIGFADEGPVATYAMVHERPTHRPPEAEVLMADDLPDLVALDKPRFGADRSTLLRLLLRDYPDTGVGLRDSLGRLQAFGFLKTGDEGSELGPLVLGREDSATAGLLLDALLGFRLRGNAASLEATVPKAQPFMAGLLEARGFAHRDDKLLMGWGQPLRQDWFACVALGGLEKG